MAKKKKSTSKRVSSGERKQIRARQLAKRQERLKKKREKNGVAVKREEAICTNKQKTPFQKMQSIMKKLENELMREKESKKENKTNKANKKKGDKRNGRETI